MTLLTLKEAAERLTISRSTLYLEHKRGAIAFVKVRGSTRVEEREIQRYLRTLERRRAA